MMKSPKFNEPNRSPNFHHLVPLLLFLFVFSPLVDAAKASTTGGDDGETTTASPSMGFIVIILVFCFFITGCISIYLQQCTDTNHLPSVPIVFSGEDITPARVNVTRGLDRLVIEAFPTFLYSTLKDLKIGKGSLECAICLNEFRDNEILRLITKCDHVFHFDCIDAWLDGHTTCPVCRTNLDQIGNLDESTHRVTGIDETPKINLPKSHSTGHSLNQPGENCDLERFTLRLPAEVRRQLLDRMKMKRVMSMVALPRELSSRWRCGGGDGGVYTDWWDNSRLGLRVSSFRLMVRADGDVTASTTDQKSLFVTAVTREESSPPLPV